MSHEATMKKPKTTKPAPTHATKRKTADKRKTAAGSPAVVWGYARVSTPDQSLERQRLSILEYANKQGLTIDRLIEAKASTRKDNKRRSLDVILHCAQQAHVTEVVFAELSRLGRSISELCRITDRLIGYGCTLHFIKEGLVLRQGQRDITTKVMLNTFSLLAEIERDLISERTKAGLAARAAQGVKLGRPSGTSKLDAKEDEIRKLYEMGVTQKRICSQVGCAQNTLSKFIKGRKSQWVK